MADYDSVIAGGGIGGLSAALCLAARGLKVGVFERHPRPQEAGAGIQLGPNATRLLDKMGVLGQLSGHVAEPRAIAMRDGKTGRPLARVPLGRTALERYGSPYFTVHRADLHSALHQAVCAHANVDLHHDAEVASWREQGEHIVFTLASGAAASGSAGIGADGVWSTLRTTLLGEGSARFTGEIGWRTLVPAEDFSMDGALDTITLWLGPGGHIVHYPVKGATMMNIVAVTTGTALAPGWASAGNREELIAAYRRWAEPCRRVLSLSADWSRWPLHERAPDPSWSRGRMTLLGDAAHPMRPYLAQGAVMAIEDACVLAACLGDKATSVTGALKRYERARRPRTARVQRASAANSAIFHAAGPRRFARNLALRAAGAVAPLRLLARQDWLYGEDVTKGAYSHP